MKILQEDAITFDDVTMVPDFSEIKSRKEPNTSVQIAESLTLQIPIIAAPMNTVCEYEMACKMLSMGADGVIHRYMTIAHQLNEVALVYAKNKGSEYPYFAVGATGDYLERAQELFKIGVRKFCIDVANGDSLASLAAVRGLKTRLPHCVLMAGNVCTEAGYARLADAGADLIRVGVGSGAMCKTRVVTGHGIPQLTALMWAARAKSAFPNTILISDGGIRNSGDLVKALSIADVVMLGSLLAGTDEAPGNIIKENGEEYKLYAGMASEDGRSLNSWFDREKTSFIPEGESVRLKCKGPVENIVNGLVGGLKVGMSYAGAFNLKQFKEKATFVRVTNNGAIEGTPHGKKGER